MAGEIGGIKSIGDLLNYFKAKNVNKDEYLTKKEVPENEIKIYDNNRDGKITLFEILSAQQSQLKISDLKATPSENNPSLSAFRLSREETINNTVFPSKTFIIVNKKGQPQQAWIPKGSTFRGEKIASDYYWVDFDPDGNIIRSGEKPKGQN